MDFKKQLLEDFADYRAQYPLMPNIDKDEWVLNYWILDKLFSVDEELITEQITDYHDDGVDCFVWHEDSNDLYIIQNKYYSEGNNPTSDYIIKNYVGRAISSLDNNQYKRSQILQNIYNQHKDDDNFSIYFHLYVTNNSCKTASVISAIRDYNANHSSDNKEIKIFSLTDIKEAYYKEPIKDKVSFSFDIPTLNKGTVLNINNEAYKVGLAIDSKYILTNVVDIFRMVKTAEEKHYPLFEENIREYLGSTGSVNKKIKNTLKDPEDRNNFFFYNNGITVIVDKIHTPVSASNMLKIKIDNPQIVNGCQTVSTIYETLSSLPASTLESSFKSTWVMLKVLEIPENKTDLAALSKNIVTYNNSQNSIQEKTFAAVKDVFMRLQAEFEGKGFLVTVKQSDKYQFSEKYKNKLNDLRVRNNTFYIKYFDQSTADIKKVTLDLEKLLQVFLAFKTTPQDATQNKSKLLNAASNQYKVVTDFIQNSSATYNDFVNLYLLYLRVEEDKKKFGEDKKFNPFYLIYCFSHYECSDGDVTKISAKLSSISEVNAIVKKYEMILMKYFQDWMLKNPGKSYNDMIKSPLDLDILDRCKSDTETMLSLQF